MQELEVYSMVGTEGFTRLVRKPERNPSDCRFPVREFQNGTHDS